MKMSGKRRVGARRMLAVGLIAVAALPVLAHFQVLVPDRDVVGAEGKKVIGLDLLFNHPMEGHLMNMVRPKRFGVAIKGGPVQDLLGTLREKRRGGKSSWTTSYRIARPGDHVFFVEPTPYWEPAEDKYIIHYTKVVVNAFGMEEGWDHELGLKTEIVPLVRPYGLWTGNVFRAVVKRDGKPVPFAEIEVEYYNQPGRPAVKAPTEAHVTQVIKADKNGVFAYAMPRAGWWGFAALTDADFRLKGPGGKKKDVELGALMWVHTVDMR